MAGVSRITLIWRSKFDDGLPQGPGLPGLKTPCPPLVNPFDPPILETGDSLEGGEGDFQGRTGLDVYRRRFDESIDD